MHDTHSMGMFQAFCNSDSKLNRLINRQLAPFLNIFLEGLPFYVFHDDIMVALIIAYIIHVNDIRMAQTPCILSFSFKAPYKAFIRGKVSVQNFNGHCTAQEFIVTAIYVSHTTNADFFDDLISIIEDNILSRSNHTHYFTTFQATWTLR